MLRIITSFSEILESKNEWNRLAGTNPFTSWEWMTNWLEYLEPNTEPLILVQTGSNGDWTGLAPFCRQTSATGSKRVRFIGSGKACSDYQNLICDVETENQFVSNVSALLCDIAKGKTSQDPFNLLELDGVTLADQLMQKFIAALENSGFKSTPLQIEGTWVSKLPESEAELIQSFSKSMRRKVKTAGKRLDDANTRIISTNETPFDSIWPTFVELHQQRRKMLNQAGCFADSEFEIFLNTSCRQLVDSGLAELTVIENSGEPLAVSMSLLSNDSLMLYQTGFNVAREKESPGFQIVLQAIRSAISRKFKTFDLLRGDEPYKARWNSERTQLTKMRIIPPTSNAVVRQNLWTSAKSLKSLAIQIAVGGS